MEILTAFHNMLKESNIDSTYSNRESLLHIAISLGGWGQFIKELLKNLNVNRQIDYFAEWDGSDAGFSSLHFCAARNISHLDTLLEHGANIRSVDRYGNTPLHVAAKCCGEYAMEQLIR